jgi:ABC-type multidrug transport system fused ATPase/permease subunit
MSWFERTPVGRILNRFSQDIQAIDCDVMNNIVGFIECGLCILQIVVIVFFTLPSLLFCFLPVAACTTWIAYEYVCVSRELKRLESISRSPILVQFGETFQGLPTLRAYSRETDLFHDLCGRIDVFNRMHLYLWLSNRW